MAQHRQPNDLPVPLGDSDLQSETLESIASAVNYHRWLTELARPYLGDSPLELGSGLGDYAQAWLDAGTPSILVTEIDAARLQRLHRSFSGDPRVTVAGLDVFNVPESWVQRSCLVAFNVLEHIPDHVGALAAAHQLVVPGGRVVIFVPAFEFAMSDFDRKVGHVRRYTIAGIRQAMEQAGLEVEIARYVNMPGLIAWFIIMRLLRQTPGDGPMLKVWDRIIVPVARWIERRWSPPFGQSVFAVARVPESQR